MSHHDKQATGKSTDNKTSLGKRKKSEPSEGNFDISDDLDSVIMNEARKKIQKVSHSNTIDGESTESESVEKMKCFVQCVA